MAKVYKKACYRPVPKNATIETTADGKQYAQWTAQSEPLSAELVETKNGPRIIQFSDVYIARYTDANGKYIERSTGCKDRRAAEHVLISWLQEVEKVKGGILTQENIDLGTKSRAGIDAFFDEYKEWHRSRGTTEKHIRNAFSQIEKVCKECKFKSASNLNAKVFSKWLTKKMKKNMGASTRGRIAWQWSPSQTGSFPRRNACRAIRSKKFQRRT